MTKAVTIHLECVHNILYILDCIQHYHSRAVKHHIASADTVQAAVNCTR